jgi:hypothetical protein
MKETDHLLKLSKVGTITVKHILNLLAMDFFFQILAHSVFKM